VSQKARAFARFLIPGRSSLLMSPGIPGLRVPKYRATEAKGKVAEAGGQSDLTDPRGETRRHRASSSNLPILPRVAPAPSELLR
jgi:hypothetical protein